MKITVLSPGLLSTIQDNGRIGYLSSAITKSGAMDEFAMNLANALVGNPINTAVIETTVLGVRLEFDCDTVIAIAGADCDSEINGNKIKNLKAYAVHAGDILKMNSATSGFRSYVAVAGGFNIDKVMGSNSTNLKCKIGGINGEKLKPFDEILLNRTATLTEKEENEVLLNTEYASEIVVRVVLGPQDDYFTKNGLKTFLSSKYTVSQKLDRMGIRLDGEIIESKNGVDIISDGLTSGSIQIPTSGTPIIMMADRQTTGGYAKIATIITVDLPLVAQAKPGTIISFKKVSYRKAVSLIKKRNKFLDKIKRI